MEQTLRYESIIISKPDINQEAQKSLHEVFLSMLYKFGGREVKFENWGKRKLAYPIKKNPKGLYFYAIYLGNNKIVRELERTFRMMENILRIFTTRIPEHIDLSVDDHEKTAESILAPEEEESEITEEFNEPEIVEEVATKKPKKKKKESDEKNKENEHEKKDKSITKKDENITETL